jgi:hypothetical protein
MAALTPESRQTGPEFKASQVHQQGGRDPSWQTTIVFESGGTTTTVFAGAGGLLLLMHPISG